MRTVPHCILLAATLACGRETEVTQPDALSGRGADLQYRIVKLTANLGGTRSRANSLNQHDRAAGFSNLPGNGTRHATVWRGGGIVDLGTLGGPNSNVQWHGQNQHGTVVGIAETGETDPLAEDWSCSAFFPSVTHKICRGFVWRGGALRALPTLGGTHGYATAVNDRDQIVGWAETPVHDPTCVAPQVLQFRAVMWQAHRRPMELPPYPGDSTSAATAINDRGQAVGISGECDVAVGRFSARHAVLWERGKPIDLGNLGGTAWHTPTAISARGDVVGFSNPPDGGDGEFLAHAFLWTRRGGIRDLGVLPGDGTSQALGVNSRGTVVGVSTSDAGVSRAFVWQAGTMRRLNGLAGPGFADSLISARDINEAGEITGDLFDRSRGTIVAYVARPVDDRE